MKRFALILLVTILFCCACSAPASTIPQATPVPTPVSTPAPTPTPLERFLAAFAPDMTMLEALTEQEGVNRQQYMLQNMQLYTQACDAYVAAIEQAAVQTGA